MRDSKISRKLAAIVSLDVVGFSRRMADDDAGTHARLKAVWQDLVEPAVTEFHGRIFKLTGDGGLAEFGSVVDALHAGVEIQRRLLAHGATLDGDRCLEFRVGIDLGDVIVDGEDIFGGGVNVATRLQGLAEPGEVWFSQAVFDQVKAKVDFVLEPLGRRDLKNIPEPLNVYRARPERGATRSAALRAIGDEFPIPEIPSLAILPFRNLSGDQEQDFFVDGLHFDLQASMVQVKGLFLIAPGTVASYGGKTVAADAAGRQMGVRYILECGVRPAAGRVQLTARLTDCQVNEITWAERFDRDLADAPTLLDEITERVFQTINLRLQTGEEAREFYNTLTDPEARRCHYRSLTLRPMASREGNAASRELYEKVVQLQPDSPVGATHLAFSHWLDVFRGWAESPADSIAEAQRWAEKATEYPCSNGLARVVLAYDKLLKGRHEEALATAYRAVQARPSCPTAIGSLANTLLYCGRADEAVERCREAMRLSPLYPPWLVNIAAAAHLTTGDIGTAVAIARQAVAMQPDDVHARLILLGGLLRAELDSEAKNLVGEIVAIDPGFSVARYIQAQPYRDPETASRLAAEFRRAGLPA